MQDEIKIAVLLGRLLELMSKSSETTDDHRATLHALAELVGRRSAALALDGTQVSVEGVPVPEETPFATVLRSRLAAHGVARVHLAHGVSAVDLVELIPCLQPLTVVAIALETRGHELLLEIPTALGRLPELSGQRRAVAGCYTSWFSHGLLCLPVVKWRP